jgi:hypothetical protein
MIDLLQGQEGIPESPTYVMIKVTNFNPFPLRDRFDGVPVEFAPGQTVNITPQQAQHFFGFPGTPDEMAVHMAKRFGWNTIDYVQRAQGAHPDTPMLFQKYAWNVRVESIEMELVPKARVQADDGLDVETMPQMAEAGMPPANRDTTGRDLGTKVGVRTGSPVQHKKNKGGRPRKQPAADPGFTPLG